MVLYTSMLAAICSLKSLSSSQPKSANCLASNRLISRDEILCLREGGVMNEAREHKDNHKRQFAISLLEKIQDIFCSTQRTAFQYRAGRASARQALLAAESPALELLDERTFDHAQREFSGLPPKGNSRSVAPRHADAARYASYTRNLAADREV